MRNWRAHFVGVLCLLRYTLKREVKLQPVLGDMHFHLV